MTHAILLDKIALGDSLFLLRFRPDPGFRFKAGQFVIVPVPADPNAPPPSKPPKGFYSICSAEQDTHEVELLIEHREGYVSGWMTSRRPGEEMSFDGPLGKFALTGQGKTQAFLGYKAGLAPLRSMILTLLKSEGTGPVHLFLGQPDLLFDAEWRTLEKESPRFHYHPSPDPAAALASALKGKDAQIYTAGFTKEIEPMLATLEAAGFDKALIKAEKFG
jgi:ferredoxin-NADP reductase